MEQQIRDALEGLNDAQYKGKSIIAEILNASVAHGRLINVFDKCITLPDLQRLKGPCLYLGGTKFLLQLIRANIDRFDHVIASKCTNFRYLTGHHFSSYNIGNEILMFDVRVDKQICPKELFLYLNMHSYYKNKQIPCSISLDEVRILCNYECKFDTMRKIPNLIFLGLDTEMYTPYQYNKIIEKYKPKYYLTEDKEYLSEVRELLEKRNYQQISSHFSKTATKSARKVAC